MDQEHAHSTPREPTGTIASAHSYQGLCIHGRHHARRARGANAATMTAASGPRVTRVNTVQRHGSHTVQTDRSPTTGCWLSGAAQGGKAGGEATPRASECLASEICVSLS